MASGRLLWAARGGFGLLARVSPELTARLALRLFSTPRGRPLTADDRAFLAGGEEIRFGNGLVATAWGEGPTVLLAHGWRRHRASLRAFVPALLARGRRVVSYDAPAHGDAAGRRTNLIGFSAALQVAARRFGPLEGILGHSLGAGAAVQALAQGVAVERLALLACPADWEHQMRLFTRAVGLDEASTARFLRLVEGLAGGPFERFHGATLSRSFTVPALLFHDPADPRVPYRDGVALAAAWPGAELITLSGLGHGGMLGDAAVIERAVAFLCPDA